MKTEDLETGKKIQSRIKTIETQIDRLSKESSSNYVSIHIVNKNALAIGQCSTYSEKANTNLEYLNRLYIDNVLRTLVNCKQELENEFELLGK